MSFPGNSGLIIKLSNRYYRSLPWGTAIFDFAIISCCDASAELHVEKCCF